MAVQSGSFITSKQSIMPAIQSRSPAVKSWRRSPTQFSFRCNSENSINFCRIWITSLRVSALDRSNANNNSSNKKSSLSSSASSSSSSSSSSSVPNSNYVVPLDKSVNSSCITRPLAEILRDLNKRVPDNIVKPDDDDHSTTIPWYHANRMLSFYAPGWCGEIRDVIFSDNGSVTVVYRVTIRGSDAEAHRESTGTVSSGTPDIVDPVAAAEQIAFCKACARFGLGLYLFHEE